jgi:hypothetical protein
MPDDPFALFIIVLVALAIYAVFWSIRRGKARQEALKTLAGQLGFTFTLACAGAPDPELDGYRLFSQGHSRRSSNILRGLLGREQAFLFDHQYTTGGGKNRQTHSQTMAAFQLEDRRLPRFELRPENVFHRIGQVFGYQDFDFPENEEFSKMYLLRGEDEQAVRALFKSYVLDHFKQSGGWHLEGSDRWLIVWKTGRKPRPEEMRARLEEAHAICDLLRP